MPRCRGAVLTVERLVMQNHKIHNATATGRIEEESNRLCQCHIFISASLGKRSQNGGRGGDHAIPQSLPAASNVADE